LGAGRKNKSQDEERIQAMVIRNFEQIQEMLKSKTQKRRLAVPNAQDEHTLDAVVYAARDGFVEPVLIGIRSEIEPILRGMDFDPATVEIIEEADPEKATIMAAAMAREGKVDAIMKGRMTTGELMKVMVNKDYGIRKHAVMSLLGFIDSPYVDRVFAITDVGMLTYPTTEQKVAEIRTAVEAFHALGVKEPKVAVLTAVENVNPKMPETVEGDQIKQMNLNGEITGCIIESPISYDLAMVKEAAEIKGYKSPVAGAADILVVPNIVAGNILIKCLSFTGGAETCGVILGAKVPLIITSRSSPVKDKFMAIVMACLIGNVG